MTAARTPAPCLLKQQLIDGVQKHLIRLSELAKDAAEALRMQDDMRVDETDREIERELGAKERAMGALREHAREHGC
ncbi:MAG TPA: hypothetical protein VN736_15325 [Candidatus Limnocylindrales bacterium]|nr:hypothetical protein [Candidatus Limnocylindrales bacterium]